MTISIFYREKVFRIAFRNPSNFVILHLYRKCHHIVRIYIMKPIKVLIWRRKNQNLKQVSRGKSAMSTMLKYSSTVSKQTWFMIGSSSSGTYQTQSLLSCHANNSYMNIRTTLCELIFSYSGEFHRRTVIPRMWFIYLSRHQSSYFSIKASRNVQMPDYINWGKCPPFENAELIRFLNLPAIKQPWLIKSRNWVHLHERALCSSVTFSSSNGEIATPPTQRAPRGHENNASPLDSGMARP